MISALSVTTTGAITPGNVITLTGHAVDWNGTPYYQFWMENGTGWHMVQNYSQNPSWTLKLAAGSYAIAVYAMNWDAIAAGYWNLAKERTVIVNVASSVEINAPSSGSADAPLTLSATATNLLDPVYQFWVENPQGQWQGMPYSRSNTHAFTPTQAGTYHVIVYAKDPVAEANPSDAVWSRCAAIRVAPESLPIASLTATLANLLPGFTTPNVALLGEPAVLTAVAMGANGQPLANVPIIFTATNDSNPSDHVTFVDGLSATVLTNKDGVATTPLMVTNPEDGGDGTLAFDPNAVTTVGYTVSTPEDPSLNPKEGSVRFAALEVPPATGAINATTGVPVTLPNIVNYVVPSIATTAPYTITASGSNPISIPTAFLTAIINLTQLSIPQGGTLLVNFTPKGSTTSAYSRTYQGPLNVGSCSIQIPTDGPGTVTFDPSSGTTLSVNSASIFPSGASSIVTESAYHAYLSWDAAPVQETVPETLSSSQVAAILGSLYNSNYTYTIRIPTYPENGDAVITGYSDGTVAVRYAYPVQTNGQGQNILATAGTPTALPLTVWDTAIALAGTNPTVAQSTGTGLAGLQGNIIIPGVATNLLKQFPPLYREMLWGPPI